MTKTSLKETLHKIELCRKNGCINEALIRSYHVNLDFIVYILKTCSPDYSIEKKKMKAISSDFLKEISINPKLKAIINKKNFKSVKLWLQNMELYFKVLKLKQPANNKLLLSDSEKIMALLNISLNKFKGNKTV